MAEEKDLELNELDSMETAPPAEDEGDGDDGQQMMNCLTSAPMEQLSGIA